MRFLLIITTLTIGLSLPLSCSAAIDGAKLRQVISTIEPCMMKSVLSWIYPDLIPPTNVDELKNMCQRQAEGFKCTKDQLKTPGFNSAGILKRGIMSFILTRQRHQKKYCANVNSDLSKKFTRDMKCVMDKKFNVAKEINSIYSNSILEIFERNYNNSAEELKTLCCTIVTFRKNMVEVVKPECLGSKETMEELMYNIVPHDIDLICEDEEKLLTKVCPTLTPLNVSKTFEPKPGTVTAGLTLYLIATLGESDSSIH